MTVSEAQINRAVQLTGRDRPGSRFSEETETPTSWTWSFQEAFSAGKFWTLPGEFMPTPTWSTTKWVATWDFGFEQASPKQLQSLWIDTWTIDQEVETEIQEQKNKTLTEDQFFNKVDEAIESWEFSDLSEDDIFNWLLEAYKNDWFTIQWIDINEELWIPWVIEWPKEEWLFWKALGGIWTLAKGVLDPSWILWESIQRWIPVGVEVWAKIPAALIDPFGLWNEELAKDFREFGLWTKEELQQAFEIDPEATSTKVIDWLAKFWLALTPTPAGKIWIINKAWKVIWSIPKIWKLAQAWLIWWAWLAKFEAISEWEITPTGVVLWAGLWIAWKWISEALRTPTWKELTKQINNRFGKLATKISPSKTTKLIADKEISKGSEWAAIIRNMNKDAILKWEDAVSNSLTASRNTRQQLLKAMEKEKWVGWIDVNPVVTWIDDMVWALWNRSLQKKLSIEWKKQFKELAKMDSKKTVKTLKDMKAELLSPAKWRAWKMSLADLDEQIIFNNSQLWPLFSKASWIAEQQALQVRAAVNNNLIKLLDKWIKWTWASFRKLKADYWKVRTFENNLDKIYAQILRKKDAQLWDFADTFILSNFATSVAAWDITTAWKATLQKLIKEQIKKQNDPNFVLEKMFWLIDKQLWIKTPWIIPKIQRWVQTWATKVSEYLEWPLWKKNLDKTAKDITTKLKLPAKDSDKIVKVLRQQVEKFWPDTQNRLADIADAIADATWTRSKFIMEAIELPMKLFVDALFRPFGNVITQSSPSAKLWLYRGGNTARGPWMAQGQKVVDQVAANQRAMAAWFAKSAARSDVGWYSSATKGWAAINNTIRQHTGSKINQAAYNQLFNSSIAGDKKLIANLDLSQQIINGGWQVGPELGAAINKALARHAAKVNKAISEWIASAETSAALSRTRQKLEKLKEMWPTRAPRKPTLEDIKNIWKQKITADTKNLTKWLRWILGENTTKLVNKATKNIADATPAVLARRIWWIILKAEGTNLLLSKVGLSKPDFIEMIKNLLIEQESNFLDSDIEFAPRG